MNKNLESDLQKVLTIISPTWSMQTNYYDKKTNFIYKANSLTECLKMIEENHANKDYALHRWYNYKTSICCEYIFCEYGAIHEKNPYNHDVDIYVNGVPFDVKLTVYPARLKQNKPYDLHSREGKNDMIYWYYANQSQQSRKQLINRIYVVCDAQNQFECLAMKSNFNLMRDRISEFMNLARQKKFNELVINDGNNDYVVKSDIVLLD